jgi:hypothetical protein
MKLFTGWVLAAGLALGATAANAQMLGPSRVSDFGGPYSEAPYRGGPYYAPPPAEVAPPPPRYGYGYEPAGLVPPHEVYSIIRQAGFSPLGIPRQRGYVYTIAVIDRGGEDGRLVIDARSGRIIRFVPAWQNGAPYEGAWNSSDGPPGPLPPTAVRGEPRPPASVPRVASRSVPVPKPNPLNANAATERAKPAAPVAAARPPAEPSSQQAAVTQAKPADAAPTTTATIGQTQAQPVAPPAILPTQDMPKAQGLD